MRTVLTAGFSVDGLNSVAEGADDAVVFTRNVLCHFKVLGAVGFAGAGVDEAGSTGFVKDNEEFAGFSVVDSGESCCVERTAMVRADNDLRGGIVWHCVEGLKP